jgi:hypothetical protein
MMSTLKDTSLPAMYCHIGDVGGLAVSDELFDLMHSAKSMKSVRVPSEAAPGKRDIVLTSSFTTRWSRDHFKIFNPISVLASPSLSQSVGLRSERPNNLYCGQTSVPNFVPHLSRKS